MPIAMLACMRALLIAVLLLGACAIEQYVFRPTEQVTAREMGMPASRYLVPPESPRGKVVVTSFGLRDLQASDTGESTRFLHVRMVVTNDNAAAPWSVDTRQQLLELPGEGRSRPAYVNVDQGALPQVQIAPTEKRTIDLYYPLPEDLKSARQIDQFDVLWNVQTERRLVAQRTPFERERVEPDEFYYSPEPYAWWGPIWWYDPFYPSATFAHPVVITHPRVRIVAPPRAVIGAPRFGTVPAPPPPSHHAVAPPPQRRM
jgi:hypothetical protein